MTMSWPESTPTLPRRIRSSLMSLFPHRSVRSRWPPSRRRDDKADHRRVGPGDRAQVEGLPVGQDGGAEVEEVLLDHLVAVALHGDHGRDVPEEAVGAAVDDHRADHRL